MTLQGTDGCSCAQNDVSLLYGTLPCILSDAEHYFPTGLMPSIRIQLTLDSVANLLAPALLQILMQQQHTRRGTAGWTE